MLTGDPYLSGPEFQGAMRIAELAMRKQGLLLLPEKQAELVASILFGWVMCGGLEPGSRRRVKASCEGAVREVMSE